MSFQSNRLLQWKKIQSIGLRPEITDFDAYTRIYMRQFQRALVQSAEIANPVPGVDEILAIHKFIFDEIHPWAGTFRGPGGYVHFDGGIIGADANRIAPAIEELRIETLAQISAATEPSTKARAMAGYLGAIRRIHPFKDGNTRTSVVLLYGQMIAVFGQRDRPALAAFDFKKMLRAAYQGHLGPLTNRILEEEGLPPLPLSTTKTTTVQPSLDPNNETEYREERERILRSQQQGKISLSPIPRTKPPLEKGYQSPNDKKPAGSDPLLP